MSVRIILAATAILAFAAPALAQTAPAAPPPSVEAQDPAEAAFEAKAEVFGARMETMAGEMQAAVTAAGGDQARATVALDALVATYQPEADAFAAELEAFLAGRLAGASEEQLAQMAAVGPMLMVQIKGGPKQARDQMLAVMAAPPAR